MFTYLMFSLNAHNTHFITNSAMFVSDVGAMINEPERHRAG